MRAPRDDPSRQGMLAFMLEPGDREEVTGRIGLSLVVEALRAVGLDEVVARRLKLAKRRRGFTEYDKVEAIALLIAAGGERVEDIRVLSEDKGLLRLLGRALPSPDALLDLLNGFDDPKVWEGQPEEEKSWVPPETPALAALFEVNREFVHCVAGPEAETATIDHDGTVIEAHKRDARVAYEGTRGYQPLVAVWVEEDLIVGDEFRDGNVPGNKDPLSSVKRAFEALPPRVSRRYFRGDSAAYSIALLKYLVGQRIVFSISADMSPELRAVCERVAPPDWQLLELREREAVHLAEVEFVSGDWSKTAAPLRFVAVRFSPLQGELFGNAERGPKYLAVVTSRPAPAGPGASPIADAMSTADLVRWHWEKAGTIEHVHRAMKDELGAGVLPCQRFGANAAWFRLNVLTYNLLTFIKRRALPARCRDARPKRLRFEWFTLPGRLSFSGRQLRVEAATDPRRTEELIAARKCLLEFNRGLRAGRADKKGQAMLPLERSVLGPRQPVSAAAQSAEATPARGESGTCTVSAPTRPGRHRP